MASDVAVIVGSLRKGSYTRMVANALMEVAPDSLACRFVEIGDLPLYNEDLDTDAPAPWRRIRGDIERASGVLFATPEYNRSIPGCLKNAIDVVSRPQGQSKWGGKPAAVISVTPYQLGAFGANHALRQTFVFLDILPMQQPEAYVGNAARLFDDSGKLTNDGTREFFRKFMAAFARWVALVSSGEKAAAAR